MLWLESTPLFSFVSITPFKSSSTGWLLHKNLFVSPTISSNVLWVLLRLLIFSTWLCTSTCHWFRYGILKLTKTSQTTTRSWSKECLLSCTLEQDYFGASPSGCWYSSKRLDSYYINFKKSIFTIICALSMLWLDSSTLLSTVSLKSCSFLSLL